MAPVKFDDLPKVAKEVLGDDFQVDGYQLKAKQKTSLGGAVATTAVDLFGKDAVQTPAKLTWKLPKPFGIVGISVDKLEMDKGGKFKLEASADKSVHQIADLKVEAKSDLVDMKKVTITKTYTGIKDTLMKFEMAPCAPKSFTLEVTRAVRRATLGVRCGMDSMQLKTPDLGLRIQSGPFFCSVLAKEKLGVYTAHACYKVTPDVKVACSYEHGGKKSGSYGVGLAYTVRPGTLVKAKFEQDQSISCGVKHDLAKGFTILSGFKYGLKDGKQSFGCQGASSRRQRGAPRGPGHARAHA
eukprot:CAMPEP_0204531928 /NCGR_PEP_ID=MMETSP0661-20131031/11445_1 /ASSEMBLY_ACC=CAM_ASM_000606 /TAXON_ID=109239 /ORGANISM="Alexandrium margalefi, Strain AMGDE01CS-322" /LENGTH=297 /DNA_ID=CAMNT_0051538121 /DNA_START=77 /DNA_END=967 /DNA_ORIENTATION=-